MEPNVKPLGYQQITTISSATGLTVPAAPTETVTHAPAARANKAFIIAETQDVRWRDDGTNPTSTVGMLLQKNEEFWYTGDINAIKFIEVTSGASLSVSYYR